MKTETPKIEYFGWPKILLSTFAKTLIDLNYKFCFTYTPFLMKDFGLTLMQWGLIQTIPEIMMVVCSALTVYLAPLAPNKVNAFFMFIGGLPSVLQPLGILIFPNISIFYWLLFNRLLFSIAFAVMSITVMGVIGNFTSESTRGRATGAVEFSWTLADYIMPLIGVLFGVAPVSVIYYLQAGAAFIIAAILYVQYPKEAKHKDTHVTPPTEELTPVITAGKVNVQKCELSIWNILKKRKVIGIIIFSVLSMAYMLLVAYFGVWLREDLELNSAQVGLAYFFAFTLPQTFSFIYMSFLSDYVGLLRSVYIMTGLLTVLGFTFVFLSSSINIIWALILIGFSIFGTEVMFIAVFAYSTTEEVSNNPSLMSSILWTAINSGKAVWVAVGPTLWISMGKFVNSHHGIFFSQFGIVYFWETTCILLAVIILMIGQSRSCLTPKAKTNCRNSILANGLGMRGLEVEELTSPRKNGLS